MDGPSIINRHSFSAIPSGTVAVSSLTAILVIVAVVLHYEALYYLSRLVIRLDIIKRLRVLVVIFGILAAHTVEIWIFAFGYYYLDGRSNYGTLEGPVHEGALDYVYFSAVTYTTLGFGDLVPVGPLRVLCGVESLTGLMLITWSASFTYLEMQRFWPKR